MVQPRQYADKLAVCSSTTRILHIAELGWGVDFDNFIESSLFFRHTGFLEESYRLKETLGRPCKKPVTELYAVFADVKLAELPPRIRRMFKDCEELSLAANGALGLWLAMGHGNHSAARELREGIEDKLTEKIDLTVDVNKDIVQRLKAARKRVAQGNKEPAGG